VHPSAELYGSDRVALESVAALVAAGRVVTVALPTPGPLVRRLEDLGAGVVTFEMAVLRKSLLSPIGAVRFLAWTLGGLPSMGRLLHAVRPDVVYVSTITIPAWLPVARVRGARVICHVHEAEEGLPAVVRRALSAPLLCADVVLTNSQTSRRVVVEDLAALRRRTRTVYNGVPGPSRVDPPRPALTSPVRLVLVGRISPRKGTDVAVDALRLVRAAGVEAELTLVGGVFPGYEWFEEEVRTQIASSGLTPFVRWAGVLPEVWSALANADVALVPSRVEPFGNTAVEALLACRPVVVSGVQGLQEIIRTPGDGEVSVPGDAESLADAVLRITRHWSDSRQRAITAQQDASARYAPSRYRDEIVEVVARLTGPDKGVPARSWSGTAGESLP
jgi:glycosyltransferase involved in cell wall biosynthesis